MQQNNTNLVNAIQGFNNIGLQITNQTNQLSAQMMQMSAKMDECCCSIKTQMLQNRLDDANAKIVEQRNEISNLNQTQTILNTLGRFVAWAGSGTQAAATAVHTAAHTAAILQAAAAVAAVFPTDAVPASRSPVLKDICITEITSLISFIPITISASPIIRRS